MTLQNDEKEISRLRESLHNDPDDVVLREHFAEILLNRGLLEEAEQEYRKILAGSPHNVRFQIGLATTYYCQGKDSTALVILENLLNNKEMPPEARVLYARLLLRTGEIQSAVREYHLAVESNPSVSDSALAEQLGIKSENESEDKSLAGGKIQIPVYEDYCLLKIGTNHPGICFKDVGGMEEIKEEIRMKIVHPLLHPQDYCAYGKPIGCGILMYGPPGCGKTYISRAVAGEVKNRFISVGINDVLDMWMGNGERDLHDYFDYARKHKPCVLFFDEVDALGTSRSDMHVDAGCQIINQFLAELDGFQSSNLGVFILSATNMPWRLDPAFLRPGRFDKVLFIPPPDKEARISILRILLTGKPTKDIDYKNIAKKTENFSGADLKTVIDTAIELKVTESLRNKKTIPVTTNDLINVIKKIRPSTIEWFQTAQNYAIYSNQNGFYDDLRIYLEGL